MLTNHAETTFALMAGLIFFHLYLNFMNYINLCFFNHWYPYFDFTVFADFYKTIRSDVIKDSNACM